MVELLRNQLLVYRLMIEMQLKMILNIMINIHQRIKFR
jgi:hypothetical protein